MPSATFCGRVFTFAMLDCAVVLCFCFVLSVSGWLQFVNESVRRRPRMWGPNFGVGGGIILKAQGLILESGDYFEGAVVNFGVEWDYFEGAAVNFGVGGLF